MEIKNNLTIITLSAPGITDFATARNTELAKVKTDWALFLDSDEIISQELEQEIQQAISRKPYAYDAYSIPRLDTFLGRQLRHGEPGHTRIIRLAHKDFGQWVRPVHEKWVGDGTVGKLNHPLLHHSHESISAFLDKINRYSTLESNYRYQQKIKSSLFKIIVYPLAKFKYNYLLRLGLLDGVQGAIMAIMMSFHSYLTWTKLYLLWHKK